jgi:hypothetical protein
VRGIEGDWLVHEPQIVPADTAAVFVGEQDLFAERRVAAARGRVAVAGVRRIERQPHRIEHVLPDAFRKVRIEQAPRDFGRKCGGLSEMKPESPVGSRR